MAIVFPASPSVNDTFTEGSITYKWDGAKWIGLGITPADRLVEGSNSLEINAANNLIWTGNSVGIGKNIPTSLLHLKSNAPYIAFEDDDNNQDWQIQATAWFAIRDQTNAAERLRITSDGKIVTNGGSAVGALTLAGDGEDITFGRTQNSGTGGVGRLVATGNIVYIQAAANTSSGSAADLVFSAYGGVGEKLRILSDGTVATGGLTATPGTVAAGSYIQAAANAGFFSNGYDGKFGTSSNHPVYFQVNGSSKASVTTGGDLQITDGNLKLAAGRGIDFTANSDTGRTVTANVLDDYEEGTWTPVFEGGTSAGTYTYNGDQIGRYVKIGRMVHVQFRLTNIVTASAGSGTLRISGLPFVATYSCTGGNLRLDNFNIQSNTNNIAVITSANVSHLSFYSTRDSIGDNALTVEAKVNNVADIIGDMTYYVD